MQLDPPCPVADDRIFCCVSFIEDPIEAKPSPSSDSRNSTPEPRAAFKDKKEAIEAFKELLREKVPCCCHETRRLCGGTSRSKSET